PGLEQAGALQQHERSRAAQRQPGGDREGLALPADADQAQPLCGQQRRLPGAQLAVGNPDDMADATRLEGGGDRGAVEHTASGVDDQLLAAGVGASLGLKKNQWRKPQRWQTKMSDS